MTNAFDIETYTDKKNNKLIPFCIAYSYNKKYNFIYGLNCIDIFVNFINNLKTNETFYAHNLSFDGIFIIQSLTKKKIKFTMLLIEKSIFNIKINSNNVVFKCSYKLFPYSLSKSHKILNCSKKIEFDHKESSLEKINTPEFKKQIQTYCINDTKIVNEIISAYNACLYQLEPYWSLKNSISGITLHIFKKYYNKHNVNTSLNIIKDHELRKSYFGGRCEIFGNPYKNEYIYHYDFKGMYAQVMLENFPVGHLNYNTPLNITLPGFYFVEVYSNMKIPILPYKNKEEKSLTFPNGNFSGLYWYEELMYFISKGGIIKKITYAYTCSEKKKTLKLFSSTMSKLRKKEEPSDFIFKLINNSLYGRLGMGLKNSETILINEKDFKLFELKNNILSYSNINELFIVNYEINFDENKIVNSNVAYASIITSKARIKLHKAFISVIENNGRLLYTDTDSIFAAYKTNVDDKTHGEIVWDTKKNDTKIKEAVFVFPKTYAIIYNNNLSSIKMKGIHNPKISYKDFEKKFYNNESHIFEENQLFNKNFSFTHENIFKLIEFDSKKYTKRNFSKNLKETSSIII